MSLKETINKVIKRKGVHSIEVVKGAPDKEGKPTGFVTTTRYHDYEKPSEVRPHKNLASVKKHLAETWDESGEDKVNRG